MKIQTILKACGDYFSGFKDLQEHKSVAQTFLGIVKCLSYCTLIIPLGAYVCYWQSRKIQKLEFLNLEKRSFIQKNKQSFSQEFQRSMGLTGANV